MWKCILLWMDVLLSIVIKLHCSPTKPHQGHTVSFWRSIDQTNSQQIRLSPLDKSVLYYCTQQYSTINNVSQIKDKVFNVRSKFILNFQWSLKSQTFSQNLIIFLVSPWTPNRTCCVEVDYSIQHSYKTLLMLLCWDNGKTVFVQ